MQIKIPHFRYHAKDPARKRPGVIELKGEVIHYIEDLDEFYKIFGYTADLARAGILPEEFIWEEFLSDSAKKCDTCFQLHIVEYLIKHSESFKKKYDKSYENWIAAHAKERSASGIACAVRKQKHPARYECE